MAGFYCAPCRLNFHFKSRYERHLKTLSHQRYALCVTGEDEPSAALFDQELAISSDAELIQDSTASTTLQLSSDASGSEQPDIDGSNDAANVPVTNPDRSEEELEADTSIVPTLDANLYKPFGSKLLAMAYLIVHSPRPMEYTSLFSPHPMKIKSMQWGGIPVVMVPITLFTDDTSGNKSKQWNKFDSWNFRLEGLSKKENGNLQNIHFICASNKVPVLDMAVPLVQEFTALENEGIIAYDAFLQRNVIVVAPILNIICDNPRGAEVCSHLGATTSKYCRICMADVTTGLHSIGCLRNKPDTLCQIARIQSARTQKEMKQLQKEFGVSAKPNPLLELFIDLHRCTPVEVLHTLLLGPYKYLFRDLMGRLTTVQRKEIQARISSFSFSGFDMKLSRNVAKYFKSFVGRDFKILAQLALFVLPPYLTPGETEVWFALSKVFKFVYCDTFLPEMVDVYKSQCLAFTHAVERNCPELRRKLKIHILLHLPDDMLQFGPASTFNTERCESYNAAIRGRNIYANRHAPSKDIATSFAIQESIRFVCSGGHYDALEKCGDELVKLYKSSEVDDVLRGGASASCEKPTYLRGAIHKVGKTKVALGSVLVRMQEIEGNISISSLMENHPQFTLLLPPMLSSFNTLVSWGKAVGTDRNIVNVGDFAQYNDGTGSVCMSR
eukprot:Em0010g303a